MDDIASQLNALLNSPEGMEQIKNVANMLGQSVAPPSASAPQNQNQESGTGNLAGLLSQPGLQEALSGLLGGGGNQSGLQNALSGLLSGAGQSSPASSAPAQNPLGGIDPGMLNSLIKLAPLLSRVQQDDDTTRLLYALRPLLGEERRKKLDEAVKMLKMMKMLPLLKGSGILGSLL